MQMSMPSSRFSLLKKGKFKSLHKSRSSRDSSTSQVRSESQLSTRSDYTSAHPFEDLEHSRPQSREQGFRQESGLQEPRSHPRADLQIDSETEPSQLETYDLVALDKSANDNGMALEEHCEKEAVLVEDSEIEDEPRISEETMKEARDEAPPFQGLSNYTLDLGKSKRLIDEDFMMDTFGITMSRPDSSDGLAQEFMEQEMTEADEADQEGSSINVPPMPSSLEGGLDLFDDLYEMEVPLQLEKRLRPRPELEVVTRSADQAPPVEIVSGERSEESESTTSSAPTLRPVNPIQKVGEGVATVAAISPAPTVESPKPRRPFSAASIEALPELASEAVQPNAAIKSANSMSSDEISGQDEKSSGYSVRSSMSSVASQGGTAKDRSVRGSVYADAAMERFDVTSLYHAALATKPTRNGISLRSSPRRPSLDQQESDRSIQSDNSGSRNVNKPLPPEPGRGSSKASNTNQVPRAGSATAQQLAQSRRGKQGGEFVAAGSSKAMNAGVGNSRGSVTGMSLRSKYTPKDLDALDEAFLPQNAPLAGQGSLYHSYRSTPSSSQNSLAAAEAQISLSTIREDIQRESRSASVPNDPMVPHNRLQLHSELTRRPTQVPQPTSRLNSAASQNVESKRSEPKQRSQTSAHIGSQIKDTQDVPIQRSATTVVGGSRSKLTRLLGNSALPSMIRKPNEGAQWPRSESPQMIQHGADDMEEESDEEPAFTDAAPSPDAHFEEIRNRLELLRPKDDPELTFLAYHQSNAARSAEHFRHFDNIMTEPAVVAAEEERRDEEEDDDDGDEYEDAIDAIIYEEDEAIFVHQRPKTPEIAELDGSRSPVAALEREAEPEAEPIELEGSEPTPLAELPLPSPPLSASKKSKPASLLAPPETAHRKGSVKSKYGQDKVQRSGSQRTGSQRVSSQKSSENKSGGSNAKPQSIQSLHSAKSKSGRSQRSNNTRSLASLTASEIPDMYAAMPSRTNSSRQPSMNPDGAEHFISPQEAERVLLRVLEGLDSFSDLFSAARVNRGFYRTFKRHELALLKSALFKGSPAAWELREMNRPFSDIDGEKSGYTPVSYVENYDRDSRTIVELKSLILDNCKSFLRSETIFGLAGSTEKSPSIDNAFWRIWSFCRIFGCDSNREEDIVGQMDWLNGGVIANQSMDRKTAALSDALVQNSVLFNPPPGFARGNAKGLTADEIYDMTELWTCLNVLVQGYQGKHDEAREYGIFDNVEIPAGDRIAENAMLEEWTLWLLTLAPPTILEVTSPSTPTKATFAHVQSQGYTVWPSPEKGNSRSTFLKEALSRVYEDRVGRSRPKPSPSPRSFSDFPQVVTPPVAGLSSPNNYEARQRVKEHAKELKAMKEDPSYKDVPHSPERPMSNFQDVLARLESLSNAASRHVNANKLPPGLMARFSNRRPNKDKLTSESRVSVNSTSKASTKTYSIKAKAKKGIAETGEGADAGFEQGQERNPAILKSGVPYAPNPTFDSAFPKREPKANRESGFGSSFPKLDTIGKPSIGTRSSSLRHKLEQDGDSPAPAPSPVIGTGPKDIERMLNSNSKEAKKNGFFINGLRFKSDRGKSGRALEHRGQQQALQSPQQSLSMEPSQDSKRSTDQRGQGNSLDGVGSGYQVRDPADLAVDKLVAMGFDEANAKRALAETDTGDSIDFSKALAKLNRQRDTKKHLARLDRMG